MIQDAPRSAPPAPVTLPPPKAGGGQGAALQAFHEAERGFYAPPASTHSAANPRGVAITPAPRPTVNDRAAIAQAIQTATRGTPRGTVIPQAPLPPTVNDARARHDAALKLIQAQTDDKLRTRAAAIGAFGPEAAVQALHTPEGQNLLKAAPGIAGRFGTGLINLPKSTIMGSWALGGALAHDVEHPLHFGEASRHLLDQMYHQDALAQLVTGHVGTAAKLANANPFGAATDLALGAGIAGRVAGVGSRALGVASDLHPLARAPIELPGGLPGIERRYSPNLFTAMLQKHFDVHGNPLTGMLPGSVKINGTKYPVSGLDREMYRRANEHRLLAESLAARYEAEVRKNPDTGPTALPIERQVQKARGDARKQALMDTVKLNALTNPRTGGIFYTGKGVPRWEDNTHIGSGKQTRAMANLESQGHEFVRRTLPRSITGSNRRVSVVIPRALYDTISAHDALNAAHRTLPGQIWGFGTQRFRRTVLPFSTKWITGNTAEAGLRSGLAGVAPWHEPLGRGLVNTMRDMGLWREADRLESQALQGTHFSMQKRQASQYAAEHPVTAVRGLGKAAHIAGKPADLSFKYNSGIEQSFARAVLGKHASEYMKFIKKQFPDLSKDERMQLLARQYAKPEMAIAAGRYGRKTLGQYAAFGPGVSNFVHKFAPFAPWYGNSVKFMGTLPVRHPAFTATTLTAANATKKKWEQEHKAISGLGGDLMSLPMTGPYKALDIGRYSPAGAFEPGSGISDPLSAAAADFTGVVAPQVSDAFKAYLGLDPFGNKLSYPGPAAPTTPTGRPSHETVHYQKTGQPSGPVMASSLLSGMLGFYPQARRILGERGKTPYSGTDLIWNPAPPVKGGAAPFDVAAILAGLDKVLNPLHPADLRARRKAKSLATKPQGFGTGRFGTGGFSSGGFPSG